MTKEKRILCQRLLLTYSVPDVVIMLNRTLSGEKVLYHEVEGVRRHMVTHGKLAPKAVSEPSTPSLKPDAEPYVDPKARDRLTADGVACQNLHDSTMAMFERKAARLRCTVQAAQMLCHYSPEQIRKMAA